MALAKTVTKRLKSTGNGNYLTKTTLILGRKKRLPVLRNSYTTSCKNANLIEQRQNITVVVRLKEKKNVKQFRSYLKINRNANSICYRNVSLVAMSQSQAAISLKAAAIFLGWFFTNQHIVVFVCQPCPFQSLEDHR